MGTGQAVVDWRVQVEGLKTGEGWGEARLREVQARMARPPMKPLERDMSKSVVPRLSDGSVSVCSDQGS